MRQHNLDILREKLDDDIYIIPVRLDDCEVPESLKKLTWVDYYHETGWARLIKSLEVARKRCVLQTAITHSHSNVSSRAITAEAVGGHEQRQNMPATVGSIDLSNPQSQTAIESNETVVVSHLAPILQWEVELQQVLNGEREYVITQSGGVKEYIETTLSISEETATSQQAFQEALLKLIKEQSPYKQLSETNIVHLLALINAYLPVGGSSWVLNFMKHKRSLSEGGSPIDTHGRSKDIHFLALKALDGYFPVSPVGSHPVFEEYVVMLRRELSAPVYSGYAVRRLIELEMLEVGDEAVLHLIERVPECLIEVISVVLNPARRSRVSKDLSKIYSRCLLSSDDAQHGFEKALRTVGASLEHSNKGPVLIIDKTEAVELDLPEETLDKYMLERWSTEAKRGIEKLMSIMGA